MKFTFSFSSPFPASEPESRNHQMWLGFLAWNFLVMTSHLQFNIHIYIHVYIYIYIYEYMIMCVYIYTYDYVYIHIYDYVYICICMYVWMDGWMHACMFLRYPWIPWFSIGSMIDSFSGPSHRDWWLKSTSETTSLKPKMGTSPNQHGHHLKTTQPSTGYVTSMTNPTQIPSNGTFTNHYCELREPQTFHMKHHKQCNQS